MTRYLRLRKPPDGLGRDGEVCVERVAAVTRSERSRLNHLAEERCEGRTVGHTLYLFRSRSTAESFLQLAERHLEELCFMEFWEFNNFQAMESRLVSVEYQPMDGRAKQRVVHRRLVVSVGVVAMIVFSGFAWISICGTPNVTVREAANNIATVPTTELAIPLDGLGKKEKEATVQSDALRQSIVATSLANGSDHRPPADLSSNVPVATTVGEKSEVQNPQPKASILGRETAQNPITLTGAIYVTGIVYHRRSDCPGIGTAGTWKPESNSGQLYACPVCYPRAFDDE